MGLYPCAWSVTFQVCHGKLNAILNQRSQDMLVANNWNVTQYAVLVHLLAREAGLAVGELIHVISDAHIYLRHIPIIEDLLKREAYPAPTLVLDQAPLDFYEVKVSDLKLEGYQHGERVRHIEVAI